MSRPKKEIQYVVPVDSKDVMTEVQATTDPLEQQIKDQFGDINTFTQIDLNRQQSDGKFRFLDSYLPDIPDYKAIKDRFGGGVYKFYLRWRKPDGTPGFSTPIFAIEGEPKSGTEQPVNGSSNHTGNAGGGQNGSSDDFLDKLIKIKTAGLLGGNGGDNSAVTVETLKQMGNMMIETIKSIKPAETKNSNLTETIMVKLLDSSLKKSNEDPYKNLETAIGIVDKIGNNSGSGESSIWAEIIKNAGPILSAVMGGGNQQRLPAPGARGPMPPAIQQRNQAAVPAGIDLNQIAITVNTILKYLQTELTPKMNALDDRMNGVSEKLDFVEYFIETDEEFDNIKKQYDADKAAENPINVTEMQPQQESTNENQISEMDYIKILKDLKTDAATNPESKTKLAMELKTSLVKVPEASIKAWLKANGILETEEEWTEYLALAKAL